MAHRASRRLLLVLGLTQLSCAGTLPGGEPRVITEQLPVRRVVLYQNGVGYFEREGKLQGNALTLHCRPSQINDLLKSLTVIDRGSGRPLSVSLPLEKGGDRVLAELPKQVRGAAGLLDVLRVFRGARVRLHGRRGQAAGRVVGVEQGLGEGKHASSAWSVTVKEAGGDLVVYPVSALERIELLDRTLEAGLDKSLDVSLEEGSWKSIALTVRLAGAEDHDLLVSYIVEMPMWKPAYRLVLQRERPPLLQGWAVVDNVSGESWRDVSLSLVTGTPMSFLYDLHAPRYARRPDLSPSPEATTVQAPPRDEAGWGDAPASGTRDALQRAYSRTRAAERDSNAEPREEPKVEPKPTELRAARHAWAQKAPEAMNVMLEKQLERVKTEVKGEKVGSLFRYDLKDAVTVPDSSSTLVNIVNARVPGEEVALFRPELTGGQAASHPYSAVKLTNASGFALEQGPVAIYSRGTFVGEGFLERMEKGSTLFLTYSIDGSVTMSHTATSGQQPVRLLRIQRGMIESEVMDFTRTTYTVSNQHDTPLVTYVKSLRPSREYKLRRPPAGTVQTAEASFVPVRVPAHGKRELVVEWSSPVRRWIGIDTSLAGTVLKLYLGQGEVPASVKPVLQKILAAKEKLEKAEAEQARISGLKSTLSEDQESVRRNLDLLRKSRGNEGLKATLTKSLASLEEQLSKLTARFVKLDEEKAALQSEMQALIGRVTVEGAAR